MHEFAIAVAKIKGKLFQAYLRAIDFFSGSNLSRFKIVRISCFVLSDFFSPYFAEIDGRKMFFGSDSFLMFSVRSRKYENFESEIIMNEIKRGDVVVDLGANIGYYTLIFSELVGESGKVFSFEPEQKNFELLKRNIEANGCKNVVLEKKLVSNEDGKRILFLEPNGFVGHTICDFYENAPPIEIESVSLDNYFKNQNGKIDFVKMDIEGAEGEAFLGMRRILRKNRNLKIITEFLPEKMELSKVKPKEFLKMIEEENFEVFEICENEKMLKKVNLKRFLSRPEVFEKGFLTNFLCKRKN